jgi:hypothetical protein
LNRIKNRPSSLKYKFDRPAPFNINVRRPIFKYKSPRMTRSQLNNMEKRQENTLQEMKKPTLKYKSPTMTRSQLNNMEKQQEINKERNQLKLEEIKKRIFESKQLRSKSRSSDSKIQQAKLYPNNNKYTI